MAIMKAKELANKVKDIAQNYKTLYVLGCIGAPLNDKNKKRYTNNYDYNSNRAAMINAASADTFGFDCVCLIKSVLWGWNGDTGAIYGGATYASNGVPDINTEAMLDVCTEVSSDFSDIEVGEYLWMKGHCGIYIGDGLAVECTPIWANKVQITACNTTKAGYYRRDWSKHGKLPYVDYTVEVKPEPKPEPKPVETVKVGDLVSLTENATYYNGAAIPAWVKSQKWYVYDVIGDRVVIDKNEAGTSSIMSAVNAQHLTTVTSTPAPTPKPKLRVGAKVELVSGAVYTNGVKVPAQYIGEQFTVQQLLDGRVLIQELYSWVATKYVKVVG